jgi:hypothetical protein
LTLLRELLNDLFDVRHKAHIEHSIGFVENEVLNRREVDAASAHVVHQTTGACHDNLRNGPERSDLITVRYATVNSRALDATTGGKRLNYVVNLLRELTGWRKHKSANRTIFSSTELLNEW